MKTLIDELLDAKHSIQNIIGRSVSEAVIQQLIQTAQDTENTRRRKALEVLAVLGTPFAFTHCTEILMTKQEDVIMKSSAVYCLEFYGEKSESILADALAIETNDLVRLKLVSAIGRVGGSASINSLSLRRDKDNKYMTQQLDFVKVLLSHKIGLEPIKQQEKLELLTTPTEESSDIKLGKPDAALLQSIVDSPLVHRYNVRSSEQTAYSIECGFNYYMLFMDSILEKSNLAELSIERPRIAGYIAQRAPEDGSFQTVLVILTGVESKNSIYVNAYGKDGILQYRGKGIKENSSVRITMEAVARPGQNLVFIDALLDHSELRFIKAISGKKTISGNSPRRLRSL